MKMVAIGQNNHSSGVVAENSTRLVAAEQAAMVRAVMNQMCWRPKYAYLSSSVGACGRPSTTGARPASGRHLDRFSTDTEVFSTDWSLKRGQNNCSSNDGTDSLRAQSDASKCLPAGLEQRDPAFAGGAQTADELVAGEVVRVEVAALGRRQHAGTGAVVAFVGQAGQPQHGGRGVQRAEEPGGAGGGEVVGRAGLDGGDRHRKAGGVTDDLHVATVGPVFAGVPQVMAGLRVGRAAPVGGDQRAVQRHVGPAGGLAGLEHLM